MRSAWLRLLLCASFSFRHSCGLECVTYPWDAHASLHNNASSATDDDDSIAFHLPLVFSNGSLLALRSIDESLLASGLCFSELLVTLDIADKRPGAWDALRRADPAGFDALLSAAHEALDARSYQGAMVPLPAQVSAPCAQAPADAAPLVGRQKPARSCRVSSVAPRRSLQLAPSKHGRKSVLLRLK